MFDSLFFCAFLAVTGVALVSAPMGCILLWRRMVFFTDSLSHSMLLGVALGIICGISPLWVSLILSLGFASLLQWVDKIQISDVLLAVSSYFALALALILLQVFPSPFGIESYLMGDILLTDYKDIGIIYLCLCGLTLFLKNQWRNILLVSLSQEMALSEGVNVGKVNWYLFYFFAIIVGFMIKITGALLAPALMVIPAFISKRISSSPEGMIIKATLISIISCWVAVSLAFQFDFSIGPSIVMSLLIFIPLCFLSHLFKKQT